MENKYVHAKILDWWRDKENSQYLAIVEVNDEWILVVAKSEAPNG